MPDSTSYKILVKDVLDGKWTDFFAPFTLTANENETELIGTVHDQAELFGVLLKIRDMGIKLVSVNPIPND